MKTFFLVLLLAATGCRTIKPYEKEYLLNPLMDDAAVGRLNNSLMTAGQSSFEKLAGGGSGGGGSSCPTCGG